MVRRGSAARRQGWGAFLGPALGGLALAAAFAPWRLWPLVFVAWVPLWAVLRSELSASRRRHPWRRAFLQGWLMGFVAFVGILHWVLALSNEEVTIPGLMIPSLLLIGFYLGLFFGAGALLLRWLARASGWPLLLLGPVVVTLAEYARSLGPLGFPWGAPAYALARIPEMLQVSAIVGFWGLVLLVLGSNALLCAALGAAREAGRRLRPLVYLGIAALLLAANWGYGARLIARQADAATKTTRARGLRVLVAQPDIRREIKWRSDQKELVVDRVLQHATAAAAAGRRAGGYDLFVWPETVLPTRLFNDRPVLTRVGEWVAREQRPVLMGTQEGYWGQWLGGREWISHNSALILYPDGGRSPIYRKMRLVPFSERFPLQKLLPALRSIDFGQSNFFPGDSLVVFQLPIGNANVSVGCLICFESAFPEMARGFVRRGAQLLVNITNDFWFQRTAGPVQHAEMLIHRAVENRVPIVRCANTGISFVVDAWGRVSHETEIFTACAFVTDLHPGSGSLAARYPDWILIPLAMIVGGALLATLGRRRRQV